MTGFDDLHDVLSRHLPRAAEGTGVSIGVDHITVAKPGLSIADVAHLLSDLTGEDGFLPDDLPVNGILLETLSLRRRPGRWSADLDFTLVWDKAGLSLGDDFPFSMAALHVVRRGTRFLGAAAVEVTFDGLTLAMTLELPAQVVTGRLADTSDPAAAAFLARRGIAADAGAVVLRDLSVEASIPFRHVALHVELENVFTIGPVSLTRAAGTVMLGETAEVASAALDVTLSVEAGAHGPLLIAAQGMVDAHGWRVAGALDAPPGALTIAALAAAVAEGVGEPAPVLPHAIADLGLSHLSVMVDTHDDSFTLDCTLDWSGTDATMTVHLERSRGGFSVRGTLHARDLQFDVALDTASGGVLLGTLDLAGSGGLSLGAVLGAFGDGHGIVDDTVDLDIKALAVALDGERRVMMAAQVGAGVDLSSLGRLPLFGALLPSGAALGMRVTPVYRQAGFDALDAARGLMPETLALPETVAEGVGFSATLALGGAPVVLDTGPSMDSAADAAPPRVAPAAPDAAASGTPLEWSDVDARLGPVHIARAGYAVKADGPGAMIDLALDGSLTVAGLTLGLDGLGARYDLATRAVTPRLQGLSLEMARGPVTIGGAFLNDDGDFAGKLVIETEAFGLHALGAFTMLDETPSMFAFGALDMPLGGPVFLFIEGLAAGFGVHRRIAMPAIEDVATHPLIAGAVRPPGPVDPAAELRALHHYLTPRLGEYFFAAGIKFNSFRLLHGYGVVVLSMGREVELDLIGTARFSTPPDLPENTPALARVALDLVARFVPEEGRLTIEARLDPRSYVYGPLCHLSGGFAFHAWFKDDRAGDFVLCIGGYHPDFDVPPDYPDVPRIELKYQVTPTVYLKGDGYFALTPSVMMAGGGLHAQIRDGSLHAWADLTVDFLVGWEPFHYDARLHIGVGAEWKCFHVTASADLHIWGPKFSGYAQVEWSVFSFDVEFGPMSPGFPMPISLDKFKASFLGIEGDAATRVEKTNATLGVVVASGAVGSIGARSIVTAQGLAFGLSTRVPCSALRLGGAAVGGTPAAPLGIAPVGGTALGDSVLSVTVTHDGHGDVSDHFTAVPVVTQFPAALWGRDFMVDKNAPGLSAAAGMTLRPARPPVAGASRPVAAKDLWDAAPRRRPPPERRPASAEVELVLTGVTNGRKINHIKAVRGQTGLGLKEAKDAVEQTNTVILSGIDSARAEEIIAALAADGVVVVMRDKRQPAAAAAAAAAAALPLADLALLGLTIGDAALDPAVVALPPILTGGSIADA